jgi:hypothetical protein
MEIDRELQAQEILEFQKMLDTPSNIKLPTMNSAGLE